MGKNKSKIEIAEYTENESFSEVFKIIIFQQRSIGMKDFSQ